MKECGIYRLRWQDWTLRACSLNRAEIRETAMRGMDVTSCEIAGITVDIPSIRGMMVNREQALGLAALLGLVIEDMSQPL